MSKDLQSAAHTPTIIHYGDHASQLAELYLPAGTGPFPIAILIHGGFWRSFASLTDLRGLAYFLLQHGIAVWNIEYRRVGESGGGWPGTLQDVAQAADHLRQLNAPIDLNKIISIGHSAGGHLALWLAARENLPKSSLLASINPIKLHTVISLAGISDLIRGWQLKLGKGIVSPICAIDDLVGGDPTTYPERYSAASPAAHLPLQTRQILIHGTQDHVVPLELSEHYAQMAQAAGDPVTLFRLEHEDHMQLITAQSYAWQITLDTLVPLRH